MKQICKFDTKPSTIVNGGYKKGHFIVWLNLSVTEIEPTENQPERYQSVTDRLILADRSVEALLDVIDPAHLAMATNDELLAILSYFQSDNDLESWKAIRKLQIEGYDSSDKVNCFYLQGQQMWFDKATRVGLVNSLNMEKSAGRVNSTLWSGSTMIQLPVETALGLLRNLELYALDCYGVTASHLAYIEGCEYVDNLRDFDISADYPKILRFDLE